VGERAAAPVAVLPLGDIQTPELRRLERVLDEEFHAPAVMLPRAPLPDDAWCGARAQFDADIVLESLFARRPERCLRVIGVADCDLYIRGRTFVFGYAHLTDGMAVYSIHRLHESFYGRRDNVRLLESRVRRAAVHELGHTFGAPHCEDATCVMHAVSQVETLDALGVEYCESCRAQVAEGLVTPPWSARGRWERGLAFLRRRDYGHAVKWLEHAARLAPFDGALHHDLAVALLGLGDRVRARQALKRARELQPETPSASAQAADLAALGR
jgi:archaemetzincin